MRRNARNAILALPVFCSILFAQSQWENKPYAQWSGRETFHILTESPWTRAKIVNSYPQLAIYDFSLLTARPVREGLLRALSLKPDKSVDIGDLDSKKSKEDERAQRRLKEFLDANPNDFLVRGDEQFIIVSLHARMVGNRSWHWMFADDEHSTELVGIDPSKLMTVTRLETDAGNGATIFSYQPPGPDNLGAKFLFKRRLPDGSPLVTTKDKELWFITYLDGREVRIKFDLRKMMYKGKLEF